MQVQIHTDHHIEGTEAMGKWVGSAVQDALARFSGQISRVEVHLSDENGGKKTNPENKQCRLEARLEGHQPLAVKHTATNLNQAIDGAVDKLVRLIDNTLGRTARV
ncbi:MAG: HPF/RaiA family ribosome-associated protein [Polaromonas sp.]|nr:HPF/RaiA family ribosome-associated protein [Polaromonas sp.]